MPADPTAALPPLPPSAPALPAHVPLVVTTRGAAVENVHGGSVAVVDRDGRLLASVGDVLTPIFTRSTIKPMQALPFVAAGGLAHFGWGRDEAALLCASHSAEAAHLAVVSRMLRSAGLDAGALGCGAHPPLAYAAHDRPPPADGAWTALHNNCSGKHAGFLACCAWRGWSLERYLEHDHPLQAAIRTALGEFTDTPVDPLPWGVDGCSAPNYALPLRALAHGYARLAAGAPGTAWAAAATTLRDAMRERPLLISGSARADLALVEAAAGDWIAKVGADGVQTLGSIRRGIGIAIKLADGHPRALLAATVEVLRQLGWLDADAARALAAFDTPPIRNWCGTETGRFRPCLTLHHH